MSKYNQWTSAHEGIKYNQQWTKYINTTDWSLHFKHLFLMDWCNDFKYEFIIRRSCKYGL